MTIFKIHHFNQILHGFKLHFKTRFLPIILSGNKCADEEGCINQIRITQQQILSLKSLAFVSSKKGYGFIFVFQDGKPVAYSRFFQTRSLMKRNIPASTDMIFVKNG